MYAGSEISLNLNIQWLINLEIINKETKIIIIKQFSPYSSYYFNGLKIWIKTAVFYSI